MSEAAPAAPNGGGTSAPPAAELAAKRPVTTTQAALTPVGGSSPVAGETSVSTREQLLAALSGIRAGAARNDVLAKLGRPAYVIGSSDGPHYVERCRFRSGVENIASIEFRDGVVTSVDRIAP